MAEKGIKKIESSDIKRVIAGIPEGHKHIRAFIETYDGAEICLTEQILAALVRAYINIKTHPQKQCIELLTEQIENKKKGYADYQLLESSKNGVELQKELNDKL